MKSFPPPSSPFFPASSLCVWHETESRVPARQAGVYVSWYEVSIVQGPSEWPGAWRIFLRAYEVTAPIPPNPFWTPAEVASSGSLFLVPVCVGRAGLCVWLSFLFRLIHFFLSNVSFIVLIVYSIVLVYTLAASFLSQLNVGKSSWQSCIIPVCRTTWRNTSNYDPPITFHIVPRDDVAREK